MSSSIALHSGDLRSGEVNSDLVDSLQLSSAPVLLRIDTPAEGMTIIGDKLTITGRIALRPELSKGELKTPPALELLVEPMEQLGNFVAGLRMVAQRYPVSLETEGIESFEIESFDSSAFGTGEFNEDVIAFEFSVTVSLAALVPQQDSRIIWISLLVRHEEHLAVSNTLTANILSRDQWESPMGGMFSPQQSMLYSDYLDISGWALRKNDTLEHVSVSINDVLQKSVKSEISSRDVSKLFPNVSEAENCRFLLCLKRSAVLNSGLSEAALSSQFVVTANCSFASGAELALRSPALSWRPTPTGSGARMYSDVETVKRTGTGGGVTIEGWLVSTAPCATASSPQSGSSQSWTCTDLATPKLFLQGLNRYLEFGVTPMTTLEWYEREDVEHMLPTNIQHFPSGFRATYQPGAFGAYQGTPRLVAQLSEGSPLVAVGSLNNWASVADISARFLPEKGVINRARRALTRSVSELGVRQSIPSLKSGLSKRCASRSRTEKNTTVFT